MRQIIIARKDLNMSPGKLAAQCCHASIAFLTSSMRDPNNVLKLYENKVGDDGKEYEELIGYFPEVVREDVYEEWICGGFTKTICEAKNLNKIMKAVTMAQSLGLEEGKDFFLIKDCCLTELTPEEVDENGDGRTLTCIGFRPLPEEVAHAISKKFQLYK